MFAVVEKIEFYQGHLGDYDKYRLISVCETKEAAKAIEEDLNSEPYTLKHGQASGHYSTAEIVDDNADYDAWVDSQDWNGCPSEDGSNYDANVEWAERRSFESGEGYYLANAQDLDGNDYRDMIINICK